MTETTPGNLPRTLTIKEAARECNVSRTTIYKLLNDRKLHAIKVRSRTHVLTSSIDSYIADAPVWKPIIGETA